DPAVATTELAEPVEACAAAVEAPAATTVEVAAPVLCCAGAIELPPVASTGTAVPVLTCAGAIELPPTWTTLVADPVLCCAGAALDPAPPLLAAIRRKRPGPLTSVEGPATEAVKVGAPEEAPASTGAVIRKPPRFHPNGFLNWSISVIVSNVTPFCDNA